MINGKLKATCNQTQIDYYGYGEKCSNNCSYTNIEVQPDKRYLFRLIGSTVVSYVGFTIEGHTMKVIQVDGGSYIEPYETDFVAVHTGQRLAVIVETKSTCELKETGKRYYWMRGGDYERGGPDLTNPLLPPGLEPQQAGSPNLAVLTYTVEDQPVVSESIYTTIPNDNVIPTVSSYNFKLTVAST